jgi:glycosyltransferase involved in cell wall biosynthesis
MDPRLALDLIRLIRRHGIALIDAHNMQSQYWSALAALPTGSSRGRVATVHSIYRDEDGDRLRRWFREGALRLCGVAGFKFVAVSKSVERYLVETLGIHASKVVLSRNGMEDLTAPPPPFELEAETGWTADSVILSIIGRLEPVKGHRFLISALASIVASGDTRLRLLIVGTGREEEKLRAQVVASGLDPYVHFTGFRNDVTSILTRTDVLCVPSISEGLPYVVLEAARQSVPVLASELEGKAEIFTDNNTIFFARPGDPLDIQRRLLELVDSPDRRRRVGAAARRLFLEDLHERCMLEETLRVYHEETGQLTL